MENISSITIKTRIEWVDITRSLAIILVVFNHATEYAYDFTVKGYFSCSTTENILKFLFAT